MFDHLGRFFGFFVVLRDNIVPWQFAQAAQAEPGPEHGKPVQSFRLVFKGGHEIVDHVQKDQPGFIMLGAFEGQAVSPLLGQAFLGDVFRKFQALGFHADVLHKNGVSIEFVGKYLFHLADAFSYYGTKTFPPGHLVDQFQGIKTVAETQIHSAGMPSGEKIVFKAFHDKSDGGPHGNGIHSIGIAVEIDFQNGMGIKNPQVGTASGNGFIFRTVYKDFGTLIRAGEGGEIFDAVGTGHCTPAPAPVKTLVKDMLIHIFADHSGFRV